MRREFLRQERAGLVPGGGDTFQASVRLPCSFTSADADTISSVLSTSALHSASTSLSRSSYGGSHCDFSRSCTEGATVTLDSALQAGGAKGFLTLLGGWSHALLPILTSWVPCFT
jgi:hypothetical protein